MYFLYKTSHLIFILCLFTAGILLSVKVIKTQFSARIKQSRKTYYVINSIVVLFFLMIICAQAIIQFSGNKKLEYLQKSYDRRIWISDQKTKKGTIFDRSGSLENALAYSRQDGENGFTRIYPFSEGNGHLLGYIDKQRGKAGLEYFFFNTLSGNGPGSVFNLKNYVSGKIKDKFPAGQNIYLTIDSKLQREAYNLLAGKKGSIVVMDPRSGAVLAMVSTPGYSPESVKSDSIWKKMVVNKVDAPLYNRVISGAYPPGSVFKLITTAAAIEKGIKPEYFSGSAGFKPKYATRPVMENEYKKYKAMNKVWKGHGSLTMEKALNKSSNVYYSQLATEIGSESISNMAERFGFNKSIEWNTSNDLLKQGMKIRESLYPGSKITPEELAWSSLGQYKVLVTPMHAALITSAIANGGKLMMPIMELGRYSKVINRVTSRETSMELRKLMRGVVRDGTGYRANIPGIEPAGKTGTAENASGDPHSWFVSFAPYYDPGLVVVVVIENGGYGSIEAVNAAAEIYKTAIKLGYFDSYKAN